ncbi:MFS transporter [Nonomuraea turkmeniaca]|uniref:MFS transporter n=1 Tax=Nonomuraea turkmeniaca TaxID=103838 RepID=A0A5S4FAN0_9ACTN|nr:MFS transporter [Nonomuraea turkmeniaca]TMR14125.1 MFS transporter [Nonomuraea turkmeniaca]
MASPTSEQTSLWRNADFMRLWAGQSLSQFGSAITYFAIPVIAVTVLHASEEEMGVIGFLLRVPMVLFLVFGVLADRVRKRPILIWTDVARFVLLMLIPIAWFADMLTLAWIYGVIFAIGLLSTLFQTAYRSYFPFLVPRENFLEGNSKLQLTESTAQTFGPGLAAALLKVLSAPALLVIDAVSYLASAIAMALIRRPEARPEPDDTTAGQVHKAIWQGMGWVLRHELIRPLAISSAVYSLFILGSMNSIYALYVIRDLGVPAAWFGSILAGGGVGSIIGALLAVKVMRRFAIGKVLLWSIVYGNLVLFLIPLAAGPVWASVTMLVAAQLISGITSQIFFVTNTTLVQTITPLRLQGRVVASIYSLGLIPAPLGALGAGLLAGAVGTRTALWVVVTIGALVPMAAMAWSPLAKLKEMPEPDPQ